MSRSGALEGGRPFRFLVARACLIEETLQLGVAELVRVLAVFVGGQGNDLLVALSGVDGPEDQFGAAVLALDDPGLTGAVGELSSHDLNLEFQS